MSIRDDILTTIGRMESLIMPIRRSPRWRDYASHLFLELDQIREALTKLPEYDPQYIFSPYVTTQEAQAGGNLIHTGALINDVAGSQQALEREIHALVEAATSLDQTSYLKTLLRKTYESIDH